MRLRRSLRFALLVLAAWLGSAATAATAGAVTPVVESFPSPLSFSLWQPFDNSSPYLKEYLGYSPLGYGLFTYMNSYPFAYNPSSRVAWAWQAPGGTSYIYRADFQGIKLVGTAPLATCAIQGIYSTVANTFLTGGAVYNYDGADAGTTPLYNCSTSTSSQSVGSFKNCLYAGCVPAPGDGAGVPASLPGDAADFGMGFQASGTADTQGQLLLTSATIYLSDGTTPSVTAKQSATQLSGPETITASGQDGQSAAGLDHGLGLGGFHLELLLPTGSWQTLQGTSTNCTGALNDECPFSASASFAFDPNNYDGAGDSLANGTYTLAVTAYSITGHESDPSQSSWQVTVNRPTMMPTPVTVTLPTPPPPHRGHKHRVRARITLSWTWTPSFTRLRRMVISPLPAGARVSITCRGNGCSPLTFAAGKRGLGHLFAAAESRLYRPGDEIFITVAAPGYVAERAEVKIKRGALPTAKLL
jgi:hypothetical protein